MVSLIIVNYRSWDHLERCLNSLSPAPETSSAACETIVVDNDSGDGRLPDFVARFSDVRFVANTGNYGFAHGCNLGAREASGDPLLFVNPDVTGDRSQIERMVRVLREHPEVSILTARQRDSKGRPQKAFDLFPSPLTVFPLARSVMRLLWPASDPDPRAEHRGLVYCDWVSGSLLMIRARDFESLGGWSEAFWMYMEDVDLCRRAGRAGLRAAFSPEAEFVHVHGGATRRSEELSTLTRTEAIISKHVYVSRQFRGAAAVWLHVVVAGRCLTGLGLGALLDLLTLRTVRSLRTRTGMLCALRAYYLRALRERSWLSERAVGSPRG